MKARSNTVAVTTGGRPPCATVVSGSPTDANGTVAEDQATGGRPDDRGGARAPRQAMILPRHRRHGPLVGPFAAPRPWPPNRAAVASAG